MSAKGEVFGGITVGTIVAWLVLGIIVFALWGCPRYQVYLSGKGGEAEYARAESNRKIKTLEASAMQDSAVMLAQAEVERAKGVAEANKIIGDSLKGNDAYLRYLWIDSLNDTGDQTIVYIPTEANLPILEAGRRRSHPEDAP